ncbi:MAG: ATP-binding protein [Bacteroidales bacterium]|nr:ATP-binding protein [Bacteroidales bacterium]
MDKIAPWLFQEKVIILYGPRQVGKTTLVNEIIKQQPDSQYLNCERQNVNDLLASLNLEKIMSFLGSSRLIVFDEAQKVSRIGDVLKLLIDTYPDKQYIATGSSSFELSNEISEPLTGRNIKFLMFPLSLSELSGRYDRFQLDDKLSFFLRFGTYPDIVDRDEKQKMQLLDELTSDYLFRDVLSFDNIRRSDMLVNLLKAIALQLGNEVSYRELSNLLKLSVETVQKYLQLFEKSFVLFSLPSFSRNLRNEIARSRKFYFYDLGVRNSLLQNFTLPENRSDMGALWENFCIMGRMKKHQAEGRKANMYFWRTYQQKEIDLIEEWGGKLKAFEFKFSGKRNPKPPKEFINTYPNVTFKVVNRENYFDFLI